MARSILRRLLPYLGSFALHALLVGVLIGWTLWRPSSMELAPTASPPVIEATLVDARVLEPPPLLPDPGPSAEEIAGAERAEKAKQATKAKQLAAAKRLAEATSRREEAARRQAAKREVAKQEAAKQEATRQEVQRREAERREAEMRRAREVELQRAIATEEERSAAASARARLAAQWAVAIQSRVQRAWIQPPSVRPGLDCRVAVTQVPGGAVLQVEVRQCNGDEAVKQSIEAAVLRASPLPSPPDPTIFERELELRFRPNE